MEVERVGESDANDTGRLASERRIVLAPVVLDGWAVVSALLLGVHPSPLAGAPGQRNCDAHSAPRRRVAPTPSCGLAKASDTGRLTRKRLLRPDLAAGERWHT